MTAGASAAERVRPGTRWVLLAVGFLWVYNGVNFLAFKVGVDALPAAFLAAMLRDRRDEKLASIRMRSCRRMRDERRA